MKLSKLMLFILSITLTVTFINNTEATITKEVSTWVAQKATQRISTAGGVVLRDHIPFISAGYGGMVAIAAESDFPNYILHSLSRASVDLDAAKTYLSDLNIGSELSVFRDFQGGKRFYLRVDGYDLAEEMKQSVAEVLYKIVALAGGTNNPERFYTSEAAYILEILTHIQTIQSIMSELVPRKQINDKVQRLKIFGLLINTLETLTNPDAYKQIYVDGNNGIGVLIYDLNDAIRKSLLGKLNFRTAWKRYNIAGVGVVGALVKPFIPTIGGVKENGELYDALGEALLKLEQEVAFEVLSAVDGGSATTITLGEETIQSIWDAMSRLGAVRQNTNSSGVYDPLDFLRKHFMDFDELSLTVGARRALRKF